MIRWSIPVLFLAMTACGGSDAPPVEPEPTVEPAPPAPAPAPAPDADKAGAAKVFFIEPADGATLNSPFHVKMGVEGMTIEPAGEIKEGHGHHHILINAEGIAKDTVVPKDETHIHYGDGSTETDLTLEPGAYTLTLQLANGAHSSYGPDLASTIKITVE